MSNFKRYQSKVFWGQMESQDLRDSFPMPAPRLSLNNNKPASEDNEESMHEDENSDQEANTTVIHIEPVVDTLPSR